MYLFIEMFTIVDAVLGTWRPFTITLQTEALKIWLYSLAVAVVLDLYEIAFVVGTSASPMSVSKAPNSDSKTEMTQREFKGSDGKTKSLTAAASNAGFASSPSDSRRRRLYRQLVIDSCDLVVPGAAVGWFALDPVSVGVAGSISALLGSSNAWKRVNS